VNLFIAIERHIRHSGEPPSAFGRKALGDPNLWRQMKCGRQLRPATAARLRDYLIDAGVRH
jgi:hypothetical protein